MVIVPYMFRTGRPSADRNEFSRNTPLSLGILLFVLDVVLIVHTAKTGRFWPWAYVILFLPGVGGVAYVVAELAPEWLSSYKGRRAREHIASALNPTRRYRQLRDEILIVDTIANRSALAEECLALGKFDEAHAHFETILSKLLGAEPVFMVGKARAEFEMEKPQVAVATLEALKERWPDYQSGDAHLLYAMALEKAGRAEEALDQYDEVSRYFPGVEPRVRLAGLLQLLGRTDESRAIAADVVKDLNRAPAHVRRNQRQWLTIAQKLTQS
jgi:hypothetical protein